MDKTVFLLLLLHGTIYFIRTGANSPGGTSTAGTSTTSTSTASTSTSRFSSTATSTNAVNSTGSINAKESPVGAVVGAVLGVLAAVTIIVTPVAVIFVLWRKNSVRSSDATVANPIYEGIHTIRFIDVLCIYSDNNVATLKSSRGKNRIHTRNGQERGGGL